MATKTLQPDPDEMLKQLAAGAARQGENLRTAVRELTLNALRSRELSLAQIKQVLKNVTEGVSLGAGKSGGDVQGVLDEALAGMDDAVLRAVQANHVALQQLASQGQSFRESHVKKALSDLERLEDDFLKTVKQAAGRTGEAMKTQWAGVLQQKELAGTETAAQVAATMEEFGERARASMREQRQTAVRVAEALTENFTTLASGILIGLSEGMQQGARGGRKDGKPG
jgi:Family of unknown function (DUF6781)